MSAPHRSEVCNNYVQACAIVAAGVWARYTFVYQEWIVPRSHPRPIRIASKVIPAGTRNDLTALRLRIVLTNDGKVRAYIPLSYIRLIAETVTSSVIADREFRQAVSDTVRHDTYKTAA